MCSIVSNSVTPRTVACWAPLSVGFSRQEYWNGLPCLPPGDLPNLGTETSSLASPALVGSCATRELPPPASVLDETKNMKRKKSQCQKHPRANQKAKLKPVLLSIQMAVDQERERKKKP